MRKFEELMERFLVPIAAKLNAQRHLCAIRDAFILIFPLTMAGSLIVMINNVFLDPNGFVADKLGLAKLFPNLAQAQAVFSPVLNGSLNIMALLIVFLSARNLVRILGEDDLLGGLTAMSVFFIIYPPYIEGNLSMQWMGATGLFVAIFVGLAVGELFAKLSKAKRLEIRLPESVPPAVARSFKVLFPIMIITVLFSVLNYILNKVYPDGLHQLIYSVIQSPLSSLGRNVGSLLTLIFVSNLLWIFGIHGPNTTAAIREGLFAELNAENLAYVAEHGKAWGAPNESTWAVLDAFGQYGGSGMTIGLIIAIFLVSKRQDFKDIAKLSIAPGIFNINEPIVFGIPIVLNPIFIIPFLVTPLVCTFIGYACIAFLKIIPPIAYGVPWTTPGPFIPFLGTGANWVGFVIGLVNIVVATLIYMPFVAVANKATDIEYNPEMSTN